MPSLPLSPRRILLGALLLAAVLLLGIRLGIVGGGGSSPAISVLTPVVGENAPDVGAGAVSAPPPAPAFVVVDVVGAVRRPGVYRLAVGARVADAVARAGGKTTKAQLAAVNLAALLADGQQVVVPSRGAPATAAPASAAGAAPDAAPTPTTPIQLTTATLEQLDSLPGIGPVTAQKIIDYRTAHGPFRTVDDLDAVPGIGPTRVEQLRGLVVP
jgi:competence protein ComEA